MLVPIGLRQIPNPQQLVPVELGGGKAGVHLPGLGGLGGGAHPLDAALDIDGPAAGLVHAHEGPEAQLLRRLLQLFNLRLFLLVLLQPLLIAALLLHGVKAVVPAVELRFAALNLNDPGDHPVQEVAVVGDGQHRAPEAPDILLQPLRGVEVQVVRRLVQQQNVRVLQDEPPQVHPGLLPAGEAVEELLPLLLGNGEAVGDFIHGHVGIIAAEDLEPLGQGPINSSIYISSGVARLPPHLKAFSSIC